MNQYPSNPSRFCTQCGNKLQEEHNFCDQCGKKKITSEPVSISIWEAVSLEPSTISRKFEEQRDVNSEVTALDPKPNSDPSSNQYGRVPSHKSNLEDTNIYSTQPVSSNERNINEGLDRKCFHCGTDIDSLYNFCHICRREQPQACKGCGCPINSGDFCEGCGRRLTDVPYLPATVTPAGNWAEEIGKRWEETSKRMMREGMEELKDGTAIPSLIIRWVILGIIGIFVFEFCRSLT